MDRELSYSEGGAKLMRDTVIKDFLRELPEKRSFGTGDIVTTIEGPYAKQGLMVVSKQEDGTVLVAPAPNTTPVSIPEAELYHVNDFKEAYAAALLQFPFSSDERSAG